MRNRTNISKTRKPKKNISDTIQKQKQKMKKKTGAKKHIDKPELCAVSWEILVIFRSTMEKNVWCFHLIGTVVEYALCPRPYTLSLLLSSLGHNTATIETPSICNTLTHILVFPFRSHSSVSLQQQQNIPYRLCFR